MDCPLNLTWTTRLQCLYNFLHRNGLQLRKVVSVCCTIVNPRYWAQWGKSGTCPSFRSFGWDYCWHYTYSLVDVCSELSAAAAAVAGGGAVLTPALHGWDVHCTIRMEMGFALLPFYSKKKAFVHVKRSWWLVRIRVEPGDVSFSRTTLYYRYQWM